MATMIGLVEIREQSCSQSTTIKSDFDFEPYRPSLPRRSSLRALRPAPLRPSPIKKPSPPSDYRCLPSSTSVRRSNQSPLRNKSRAACQSSPLVTREPQTPISPRFSRSRRSKSFRLGRRVHITRTQTLARSLLTRRAVLKAPRITPLYKVMSGPMRDQVTEDGHLQSQSVRSSRCIQGTVSLFSELAMARRAPRTQLPTFQS